jgi:DNA-directed RNA polymerase subunit L
MKLKTIKKTTKELELEVDGETETLLNPITEILVQNPDVEYAAYFTDHPESRKRRLYLRVTKGNPIDILGKSVKQLEDEMKNFTKTFEGKKKTKSKK